MCSRTRLVSPLAIPDSLFNSFVLKLSEYQYLRSQIINLTIAVDARIDRQAYYLVASTLVDGKHD